MLMALLYTEDEQIIAAAPACEQIVHGDDYWLDFHEAELSTEDLFETAFMFIADPILKARLLRLGIDDLIDSEALTQEVQARIAPIHVSGKAA